MKTLGAVTLACIGAVAMPSLAAAENALYPVQIGDETVRYLQGTPTLDLESQSGAVQITPLPFDHGGFSFKVAIYNKSLRPANFDSDNIRVNAGSQTLTVFTKDQLVKKAKSRAMWSQIGIAMLAGAAAAAASQAYTTDTYRSYTNTPWGGISHVAQWRNNSVGILGAAAATAAGTAGIIGVQNRLDYTVRTLGSEIVQTTTIDPDASYAGRIVIEKIKNPVLPTDVRITVAWNGTDYPFAFRLTKVGENLPPPYTPGGIAAALPAAGGAIAPQH